MTVETSAAAARGTIPLGRVDMAVDHVRGDPGGHLILEYGDYQCPYSRRAFREIERVERQVRDGVRVAVSRRARCRATPTLFIDGVVHRGAYDAATLLKALAR
jgi:protein-disulfide isomerase